MNQNMMMKLYHSGPMAGETYSEWGSLAYSVRPDPAFTGLDGAKDYPGRLPDDGEAFVAERFNAHLRRRRAEAGVTWESALAAHIASYPHEAGEEEQRLARPTFP